MVCQVMEQYPYDIVYPHPYVLTQPIPIVSSFQ